MEDDAKKPVTGRRRDVVIKIDKLIYSFSKHWVKVFTLIAAIYVGLPILAPVLMNAGLTGAGRAIYFAYSPFCHQMASRSFFLFGEQYAYPRALAGTDLTPIEAYMGQIPELADVSSDMGDLSRFMMANRRYLGDETLGYKMALCERDIAIYGFVVLGSIIYGLLRRRFTIRPMPIWLFLLVGIGPIALDGFSQLLSQYGAAGFGLDFLNSLFALRESTPFWRTFTGALFGLSLVWLTYPHIEKGMAETEEDLGVKLRRVGALP